MILTIDLPTQQLDFVADRMPPTLDNCDTPLNLFVKNKEKRSYFCTKKYCYVFLCYPLTLSRSRGVSNESIIKGLRLDFGSYWHLNHKVVVLLVWPTIRLGSPMWNGVWDTQVPSPTYIQENQGHAHQSAVLGGSVLSLPFPHYCAQLPPSSDLARLD